MVSIKGEEINMRSGPGTNYSVLYKLGSGMPLEVIKRSDDWIQIVDFENETGWVHQTTVDQTPWVIVKANKNSTAQINIRSGPGIENKIVGKAFYGVVFKKLNEKNQWVEVEHDKGVKGWIDRKLLWGY
jgi:SH3-like domain-containing protein